MMTRWSPRVAFSEGDIPQPEEDNTDPEPPVTLECGGSMAHYVLIDPDLRGSLMLRLLVSRRLQRTPIQIYGGPSLWLSRHYFHAVTHGRDLDGLVCCTVPGSNGYPRWPCFLTA